jgi:Terminase DNA packaging enzyme
MEKLSNTLGIEYSPMTIEGRQVAEQDHKKKTLVPSDRVLDEEEDYRKTREIYNTVAEVGVLALSEIGQVAKSSNSPRAYEVIATLIKSLNETAKNMSELHLAEKTAAEQKSKSDVNIEKAVFVGSQADLLKSIREQNGN